MDEQVKMKPQESRKTRIVQMRGQFDSFHEPDSQRLRACVRTQRSFPIFGFTVCVAIGFLFFSVSRYYSLGVRSVYDDDHSYLIRLLKPGRNTCVIIEREEEGGGV